VSNLPARICPICRGNTAPYDKNTSGVTAISHENCGTYYTSYEVILEGLRNSGLGNASPGRTVYDMAEEALLRLIDKQSPEP
jgi:hypothetical protein